MHKRIKGVMPDGTRYHSLEPGAFAWVHATLVHSMLKCHQRFGRPPTPRERDVVYADWRVIGEHIGVRPRDLPETYVEFADYVRTMERETLEPTESVPHRPADAGHAEGAARPVSGGGDVAGRPLAGGEGDGRAHASGCSGPSCARRLGLPWSQADRLRFEALAAAQRAASPLLPRAAREFGPTYLHHRRGALARQGFALAAA